MDYVVYMVLLSFLVLPVLFLVKVFKGKKYSYYWIPLSLLAYSYLYLAILLILVDVMNSFGDLYRIHDCIHRFILAYFFYILSIVFILPAFMAIRLLIDLAKRKRKTEHNDAQ